MSNAATIQLPTFELRHRLALSMEHAGLTKADMADQLGKSTRHIRNYLAGRNPVPRDTLIAWAAVCGVTVEWLLDGSGLGFSASGCITAECADTDIRFDLAA